MEVWQMTDEQLGEEFLRAYDAVGKEGASAIDVWMAQQVQSEAHHRLLKLASKLNLKIESIANKPLGR